MRRIDACTIPDTILSQMKHCTLCPRNCGADRTVNIADHQNAANSHKSLGFCKAPGFITAARAALHLWEEPCLTGTYGDTKGSANGSGTVFFSGCNLGCIFCQNDDIAHQNVGKEISLSRLSEIFLELQKKGAANINLVTPTHYIPHIAHAIRLAKEHGLTLPIVYNTSGYEKADSLKQLSGLIDIYLPDCKYYSSELSAKYSHCPDYFSYAASALDEMYRQVGTPCFDAATGLMTRGMIVRHLVLPGQVMDSLKIIEYLYQTFHDDIYISIMNQYTPMRHFEEFPELNRKLTTYEYQKVMNHALSLGVEKAFIQNGRTAESSFIPAFDFEGL